MKIADSILAEVDQEAETTKRLLNCIPEDKLAWKPHPKSFSLGQLALHIAVAPGAVAESALLDTMEAPSFVQSDPCNLQDIRDAFSAGLEKAKAVLHQMDDARMNAIWTLTRNGTVLMSVPRVAFIGSIMMNHIYHHRGQLSVYLRLLDVPLPSIYGPSADTNPFA